MILYLNLVILLISQQWNDIYYNKGNNSENFKYKSQNLIIFKSKKNYQEIAQINLFYLIKTILFLLMKKVV